MTRSSTPAAPSSPRLVGNDGIAFGISIAASGNRDVAITWPNTDPACSLSTLSPVGYPSGPKTRYGASGYDLPRWNFRPYIISFSWRTMDRPDPDRELHVAKSPSLLERPYESLKSLERHGLLAPLAEEHRQQGHRQ
jgi:hypothetical protein